MSDTSLRRYGKATRLQAAVGKVPPALHRFGDAVIDGLEAQITAKAATGNLLTPIPDAATLSARAPGPAKRKPSRG